MTIKELCREYKQCCDCPFEKVCDLLYGGVVPDCMDDTDVKLITFSIIETAKMLVGKGETNQSDN